MYSNFINYSKRPVKKQKDKINICIFYKDRVPFDLRLVSVFNELSKDSKYNFFIVYPQDYAQFKEDILKNIVYFDFIVLQRDYFDFEIAKLLIDKSKKLNYNIIYEIDDDLIHMDESNPGYGYYMLIKEDLENFISHADFVTVTTDYLKKQILYLNENIHVIPNRLIPSWFEHENNSFKSENTIKIGYMGSIYHSWDLVLITEAIKNVQDYFSKKGVEIIFELVGGTTESLDFAKQIEIPADCEFYFNFVEWFKTNIDWDIAIAPLEDSNINLSKSELKYLEYSALKIPGVYSAVGPYKKHVINGKTGLLVYHNSSEEWTNKIIQLIDDETLRLNIANYSFEEVNSSYLMDKSIEQWIELLEKDNNGGFNLLKSLKQILNK